MFFNSKRMFPKLKILILCLCPVLVTAQFPATPEQPPYFARQFGGGVFLATNGLGIHGFYGVQNHDKHTWIFSAEIGNIKHQKQSKIYNNNYEDARGYYYGKLNSLMYLNLGFGGKHLWFESKRLQGVELSGVWSVGVDFGYLKPVYLKIREPYIGGTGYEDPVDQRYDPTIHYQENIYGKSSFFKGFGQGELRMGLQAKAGILFNLSKFDETIAGIEFGAKADLFVQPIEMMYNSPKQALYSALYAKFVLGAKRQ